MRRDMRWTRVHRGWVKNMQVIRSRARVLGVLGGLVLTVLACSRSAQQTNFLGKACTAAGDCPPELLCVVGACREPCGADGACDDGFTCQFGACVPGGTSAAGDAGVGTAAPPSGTTLPAPDSSVPDGGKTSGSATGDGTLVLASVPPAVAAGRGTGFGANDLVYLESISDNFGVTTTRFMAVAYASGATRVVYTFPAGGQAPQQFAVAGTAVYFATTEIPASLERVDLGTGNRTTVTSLGNQPGGWPVATGSKVAFIVSNTLRLYDWITGVLDPVSYGAIDSDMLVAVRGTELTWMARSANLDFYQATVGTPGTKKTRTLPSSSRLDALAASGSTLLALVAGGQPTLYTMSLDDSASPLSLGATGPGSGGRAAVDDGAIVLVESQSSIVRVTATGAKTTIGNSGQASVTSVAVVGNVVYALASTGSASSVVLKWARP